MRTKKAFDRATGAEIKRDDEVQYKPNSGPTRRAFFNSVVSEKVVSIRMTGRYGTHDVHPNQINARVELTEDRLQDPAVKALLVILLTWKTRQRLFNDDPMAFRQAEDALFAQGSDVREHYEAGVKRLYELNH
jgi:hypothetical protein